MGKMLFPNLKADGTHSYHCSLNCCTARYDNFLPHFTKLKIVLSLEAIELPRM